MNLTASHNFLGLKVFKLEYITTGIQRTNTIDSRIFSFGAILTANVL